MRELSLTGFIAELAVMDVTLREHTAHSLEHAARVVEAEAKAEIGHYQGQVGQFVEWAELADSTKDDRAKQGYPENEPLLRDGTLRDSIGHRVEVTGPASGVAVIGSDSEIAVYQELGTAKIPPRSFLGGALVRKTEAVHKIIGEGVAKALTGEHGGRR